MKAATHPRNDRMSERMLFVQNQSLSDRKIGDLPEELKAGDLLVLNDAATLPASLKAKTSKGETLEIRLCGNAQNQWTAIFFAEGSWKTRTEDRARGSLQKSDLLHFSPTLSATVLETNGNLASLKFHQDLETVYRELYREGRPIQYSHIEGDLNLWSVQTIFSAKPYAFEMPSAGHVFTFELVLSLLGKGVRFALLTHAAGVSSTGNLSVDRSLPFPERFEIPEKTWDLVQSVRRQKGRVIAVGTSVVRALESQAREIKGMTDFKLNSATQMRVVDGILTGTHDASETHYDLLRAFASETTLKNASLHLEAEGYLTHEFGDSCLVFRET